MIKWFIALITILIAIALWQLALSQPSAKLPITENTAIRDSSTEYDPVPYSFELDKATYKKVGGKPPYAALFQTPQTSLLYVAARHTNDTSSKTFRWIEEAFKNFSPDLVIVEGIESSRGVSPQNIIKHINNKCLDNWTCGEPLYTAHLASTQAINFVGGEIDNKDILNTLKKGNYSARDIAFFHFTRRVPSLFRKKKTKEDISKAFSISMKYLAKGQQVQFADYQQWLSSKMGTNFTIDKFSNANLAAPIKDGNYIQNMVSKIDFIRDKHILNLIFKNVHDHKRVLIVYGHSHLSKQHRALSKKLGKPIYFPTVEDYKNFLTRKSLPAANNH